MILKIDDVIAAAGVSKGRGPKGGGAGKEGGEEED
jgi:hypothetical protein